MKSRYHFFSYLLLIATITQGCVASLTENSATHPSTGNPAPEEFSSVIATLQESSKSANNFDTKKQSQIHRELAKLHLSPKNPNRDRSQAETELKKYLEINQKEDARIESEIVLLLLKEIRELQDALLKNRSAGDSLKQKDSHLKKLTSEIDALKKKQAELQAEKRKLETTLEKLKFLDLNLEKKRKNFR